MKKAILFLILLLFISALFGLEVIIGCGTSVTGDSHHLLMYGIKVYTVNPFILRQN